MYTRILSKVKNCELNLLIIPLVIACFNVNCRSSNSSDFSNAPIDFGEKSETDYLDLKRISGCSEKDLIELNSILEKYNLKETIYQTTIDDMNQYFHTDQVSSPESFNRISDYQAHQFGMYAYEVAALKAYTSHLYEQINPVFFDPDQRQNRSDFRSLILCLASGYNKIPSYVGAVRRGTSNWSTIIERYSNGKDKGIWEPAFVSTGMSIPGVWANTPLQLLIHSKAGARIDWLSKNKNEQEVLFLPGSFFYVHNVTKWEKASPAPPGYADYTYKVELEEIFPDIDQDESWCSEDEMWDKDIEIQTEKGTFRGACRYKFNQSGISATEDFFPAPAGVVFPYTVFRGQSGGPQQKCTTDTLVDLPSLSQQASDCMNCYPSLPKAGLVEIDWDSKRKGRRYWPSDFSIADQCDK